MERDGGSASDGAADRDAGGDEMGEEEAEEDFVEAEHEDRRPKRRRRAATGPMVSNEIQDGPAILPIGTGLQLLRIPCMSYAPLLATSHACWSK
jgi:hypothetical protein